MPLNRDRKSTRLPFYDYSQSGYYFVTICTKNREEWFGEIKDGKMALNQYGEIVEGQWKWLGKQYPYVALDEYVIMPNHLHGIIILVGDGRDRSLRIIKSISSLIGAFKTTSSKLIHLNGLPHFQWQKSFYDHVIRNEQSLMVIRKYIANNASQDDLKKLISGI